MSRDLQHGEAMAPAMHASSVRAGCGLPRCEDSERPGRLDICNHGKRLLERPGLLELPSGYQRSTSRGLSDETPSEFGLCSVVVLVVVHSEAQQALVLKPLVEKKVTPLPTVVVGAQATRPG